MSAGLACSTSAIACDVQRYCSCSCRLWRYVSLNLNLMSDAVFCGACDVTVVIVGQFNDVVYLTFKAS